MEKRGRLLTEDATQSFFKIAYPEPVFREYVDYYFEIQHAATATPFHINGLPSANSLIAFNLNEQPWFSVREGCGQPVTLRQAQLLGQLSILHTGTYPPGMHAFFVKLTPGIATLLFREQATSFINEQIDFSWLWKDASLEERMFTCSTFEERIQLFQNHLLPRVTNGPSLQKIERLHRMMRSFHSLQLKGEKEVEKICKANWVTYSSARRDFLQYVGFTPKYCQKIGRLKSALKAYQQMGHRFYYEDYGYTDFSHFARDAKQITGRPPSGLI
jgi:hypothetical protein